MANSTRPKYRSRNKKGTHAFRFFCARPGFVYVCVWSWDVILICEIIRGESGTGDIAADIRRESLRAIIKVLVRSLCDNNRSDVS